MWTFNEFLLLYILNFQGLSLNQLMNIYMTEKSCNVNNQYKCIFLWWKKSIKNKRIVRKLPRLTIVASSSLVTCICTVAVEAVPGLWAFTTMFTIIRQTPKMQKKEHVHSLFCSFTCHLYLSRDEKSEKRSIIIWRKPSSSLGKLLENSENFT